MITEQQSKMIDYLIAGQNKTDIAKQLGVSRQTIYAWIQLKEVKEESNPAKSTKKNIKNSTKKSSSKRK